MSLIHWPMWIVSVMGGRFLCACAKGKKEEKKIPNHIENACRWSWLSWQKCVFASYPRLSCLLNDLEKNSMRVKEPIERHENEAKIKTPKHAMVNIYRSDALKPLEVNELPSEGFFKFCSLVALAFFTQVFAHTAHSTLPNVSVVSVSNMPSASC